MKKLIRDVLIFWCMLAIMALIIVNLCHAKDFTFSVTGQAGYDRGTWESGVTKDSNLRYQPSLTNPSRTGTHHDDAFVWGGSIQTIYNRWNFKSWKPTLDFTYKHGLFNFTDVQSSEHTVRQDVYSFRIGLTKEILKLNVYAVGGYSFSHMRPCLVEMIEGKSFDHDHDRHMITQRGPSAKIGLYKLYGGKVKFGPEISAEIYPKRNTEFHSHWIVPFVGIRLQY
jgi:hypothetical protein